MPDDSTVVPNVRRLTADDLGIGYAARAEASHGSSAPDAPTLRADDPRLTNIVRLLKRFGGVILSGPPGTSKSWLAGQVADQITNGDNSRRADIQFHGSYQFEDFMEGYRPAEDGSGFVPRDGVFLRMAKAAKGDERRRPHVIVIDELSRADVGRVFGEALTYIEQSKRGEEFTLPSGKKTSVPTNLYVVATMNPLDRGVDEIDAAFERRFAKIDMPPRRDLLEEILDQNGVDPVIIRRLLGWFSRINARTATNPAAAVGHAYFVDVVDADSLQDVWEYQLQHHVRRVFQYDQEGRDETVNGWSLIFGSTPDEQQPGGTEVGEPAA